MPFKSIPRRIVSITPLETKVQLNKTSRQYIKYVKINKLVGGENIEEVKKASQLIVYPDKKQFSYTRFLPDGSREKIVSEEGTRTYFEKKPHTKNYVKTKELVNGVPNLFEWYMNLYDEAGNFVKQIIKGVKGSPFEEK